MPNASAVCRRQRSTLPAWKLVVGCCCCCTALRHLHSNIFDTKDLQCTRAGRAYDFLMHSPVCCTDAAESAPAAATQSICMVSGDVWWRLSHLLCSGLQRQLRVKHNDVMSVPRRGQGLQEGPAIHPSTPRSRPVQPAPNSTLPSLPELFPPLSSSVLSPTAPLIACLPSPPHPA